MRRTAWCAAVGGAALTAALVAAEPPVTPTAPPAPIGAADTAARRQELIDKLDALTRRLEKDPAPRPAAPSPAAPPRAKYDPTDKPLDPVRAATNEFQAGNYEGARLALRLINPGDLGREDRAFVQYLTASALRKLNRRDEAMAVYREVADAKDDEFYAECAVWQLSLLRSSQELEGQLEQLRARAKSR